MKAETVESEKFQIPKQLTGFRIGNDYYGIPVMQIQEVVKPQRVTPVPLSADYIRGLINLRGQIVTSLSLRKLFGMDDDLTQDHMNVIVNYKESLYALVVDEILDVIDVEDSSFTHMPDNIDESIKMYSNGVFKQPEHLIILLDLEKILKINN